MLDYITEIAGDSEPIRYGFVYAGIYWYFASATARRQTERDTESVCVRHPH